MTFLPRDFVLKTLFLLFIVNPFSAVLQKNKGPKKPYFRCF